jgi:predicted hydrocarbon binding protein
VIWDDFVVLGVCCDVVVCVAAEPAPSSGNKVGAAEAAALAGALEKNTSLKKLNLYGES